MPTAPARPRSTRKSLVRRHVDWPPTADKLYDAITVPRGFRKELSLGRVRIHRPGRKVDQALLDLADRLAAELPDGSRLNIYAGQVVVGGFPRIAHGVAIYELSEQLRPAVISHGWTYAPGSAVVIPHLREHIGPDVMLVHRDAPTFDEAFCGEGVPLVAEVTSPGSSDEDHDHKQEFYGHAGVAIYLIVDLRRQVVIMHTRPHASGFRDTTTVPFGKPLALPHPIGITIDTAALQSTRAP
jgi:Uma2 family endonuclease